MTYQIIDSPNESHADNVPTSTSWRIQVAVYSKDPAIVQVADQSLKAQLLLAGFLRVAGRALPYNAQTGHFGWVADFNYYEQEG